MLIAAPDDGEDPGSPGSHGGKSRGTRDERPIARPRQGHHRATGSALPVSDVNGTGRSRCADHRSGGHLRGRSVAAGRPAGSRRVPAGGVVDRATGQAPAIRRGGLHLPGAGHSPCPGVPGRLGVRAGRGADRAGVQPPRRLPGGLRNAGRVQLAVHRHLGHRRDRGGGPGSGAELPGHRGQRASRCRPCRARDRSVRRSRRVAGGEGGLREHAVGLHAALRDGQGLSGVLRDRRRVGLHDPGVRRL